MISYSFRTVSNSFVQFRTVCLGGTLVSSIGCAYLFAQPSSSLCTSCPGATFVLPLFLLVPEKLFKIGAEHGGFGRIFDFGRNCLKLSETVRNCLKLSENCSKREVHSGVDSLAPRNTAELGIGQGIGHDHPDTTRTSISPSFVVQS